MYYRKALELQAFLDMARDEGICFISWIYIFASLIVVQYLILLIHSIGSNFLLCSK